MRSPNPDLMAKFRSTRHVVALILSHSSLVGKMSSWSRQEHRGKVYRQIKGTTSSLHAGDAKSSTESIDVTYM